MQGCPNLFTSVSLGFRPHVVSISILSSAMRKINEELFAACHTPQKGNIFIWEKVWDVSWRFWKSNATYILRLALISLPRYELRRESRGKVSITPPNQGFNPISLADSTTACPSGVTNQLAILLVGLSSGLSARITAK